MGWTYAFERPADPKAELDGLLTWSDARGRRRVLDSGRACAPSRASGGKPSPAGAAPRPARAR